MKSRARVPHVDRNIIGFRVARQHAARSPFALFEESPIVVDGYSKIQDGVDAVAKAMHQVDPRIDDHENGGLDAEASFIYGVAVGPAMAGRGAR